MEQHHLHAHPDIPRIGIGKSGTTANNPFKKSWFSRPQYPVVLRGADDDMKRVTYSTIDEMINEGLLVHEKRKQKEPCLTMTAFLYRPPGRDHFT